MRQVGRDKLYNRLQDRGFVPQHGEAIKVKDFAGSNRASPARMNRRYLLAKSYVSLDEYEEALLA